MSDEKQHNESRFADALQALEECFDSLNAPGYAEAKDSGLPESTELSPIETLARRELVSMCKRVLQATGCEVEGEPRFHRPDLVLRERLCRHCKQTYEGTAYGFCSNCGRFQ